jgi:hypothetical protein
MLTQTISNQELASAIDVYLLGASGQANSLEQRLTDFAERIEALNRMIDKLPEQELANEAALR